MPLVLIHTGIVKYLWQILISYSIKFAYPTYSGSPFSDEIAIMIRHYVIHPYLKIRHYVMHPTNYVIIKTKHKQWSRRNQFKFIKTNYPWNYWCSYSYLQLLLIHWDRTIKSKNLLKSIRFLNLAISTNLLTIVQFLFCHQYQNFWKRLFITGFMTLLQITKFSAQMNLAFAKNTLRIHVWQSTICTI